MKCFVAFGLEGVLMRFLSALILASGLLMAGGANAIPVNWTLTNVSFTGGKTLSGNFTFDADTNTYIMLNLVYFDGTNSYPVNWPSTATSTRLIVSTFGVNGNPGADLSGLTPALSNAGGTVNLTAYVGTYNGSNLSSSVSNPATLTGVPTTPPAPSPAPIPTLSEWAQIMMMFLMILTVGWYGRRLKQR